MLSYNVKIDEVALQMQATRSTENDLVIVVSNRLSEPNLLVIYAKRWRIECLFANLKVKDLTLKIRILRQKIGLVT